MKPPTPESAWCEMHNQPHDPNECQRRIQRAVAEQARFVSAWAQTGRMLVFMQENGQSVMLNWSEDDPWDESDEVFAHDDDACGWTGLGTCPECGQEVGRIEP